MSAGKGFRYSMKTTCEVKKQGQGKLLRFVSMIYWIRIQGAFITIKLGFLLVCYRSGSRRRIDLDHIFDRDDTVFSDGAPNSTGINYSSSVPSNFDK